MSIIEDSIRAIVRDEMIAVVREQMTSIGATDSPASKTDGYDPYRLYTVSELSRLLGSDVSENYVRSRIKSGELKVVALPGKAARRVPAWSVREYLEGHTTTAEELQRAHERRVLGLDR